MLPWAPLARYIKQHHPKGVEPIAYWFGRDTRPYWWQRTKEIPLDTADEVAVHVFGVHPCAIWGDLWWEDKSLLSESSYTG
jgi:hypothetical protein